MPANEVPISLRLTADDQALELQRAELYGLLSRLWMLPPDAELLQQFAVAVTEAPQPGGPLEQAWQTLVSTLRATTVDEAAAEYDALFLGIGKPEVFLYGSYYLAGFLNERPLAQLRHDLAALGLTRDTDRGETEDHVAYGLEVMRYLIAGDDPAVCHLAQQRRFFRGHLQPWVGALCDAVQAHPRAQVWSAVAGLTRCFVDVESQAFDLDER
jgi:TorA maturation chaperone TorD